jgi:hypothetical protein
MIVEAIITLGYANKFDGCRIRSASVRIRIAASSPTRQNELIKAKYSLLSPKLANASILLSYNQLTSSNGR